MLLTGLVLHGIFPASTWVTEANQGVQFPNVASAKPHPQIAVSIFVQGAFTPSVKLSGDPLCGIEVNLHRSKANEAFASPHGRVLIAVRAFG